MKHFSYKNGNIPQVNPAIYKILLEMLVDLSETNFEKLEVNFPIGKVVFMPQNNIKSIDLERWRFVKKIKVRNYE